MYLGACASGSNPWWNPKCHKLGTWEPCLKKQLEPTTDHTVPLLFTPQAPGGRPHSFCDPTTKSSTKASLTRSYSDIPGLQIPPAHCGTWEPLVTPGYQATRLRSDKGEVWRGSLVSSECHTYLHPSSQINGL